MINESNIVKQIESGSRIRAIFSLGDYTTMSVKASNIVKNLQGIPPLEPQLLDILIRIPFSSTQDSINKISNNIALIVSRPKTSYFFA